MKLSNLNDPELGPLLSVIAWVLLLLIFYLGVTLPFSPNAAISGSVIGGLCFLLGTVVNLRGRIGDRRDER